MAALEKKGEDRKTFEQGDKVGQPTTRALVACTLCRISRIRYTLQYTSPYPSASKQPFRSQSWTSCSGTSPSASRPAMCPSQGALGGPTGQGLPQSLTESRLGTEQSPATTIAKMLPTESDLIGAQWCGTQGGSHHNKAHHLFPSRWVAQSGKGMVQRDQRPVGTGHCTLLSYSFSFSAPSENLEQRPSHVRQGAVSPVNGNG